MESKTTLSSRPKPIAFRTSAHIGKWWLAATLSISVSCGQSRFPEPFWITTRSDSARIVRPGQVITLNAQCRSGEQLLGGGYAMLDDNVAVITGILASYPSSDTTWTVTAEVLDRAGSNRALGNALLAFAYCFTTPRYPLDLVTVRTESQGTGVPFSTWGATCPAGSVLVGGGYQTGSNGEAGFFNENVMASAPDVDRVTHKAIGWKVSLAYVLGEAIPRTTVFARCAQRGLQAAEAVIAELDATRLGYAFGWTEWEARCPFNTFTTAGGYSLQGDALIPHTVAFSSSQDDYLVWRYRAQFGYQTTRYNFRPCDPTLNPHCELLGAIAACTMIPNIPFVKVKITAPTNGESFGPVSIDSSGNGLTAPILFTGEAFDEAGAPLTGDALHWYRDGIPLGSGTSVQAQLPASINGVSRVQIRLDAIGRTTLGSDQITLLIGSVG